MRYTIEGFSQEYAMTLKKTVPVKDKQKTIQIDCTDLVILRWFVDFFPNMKKITVDGREYAWLTHKKLLADLPLLDITKRACIERMQKLVEFEILDYQLLKDGGTFSLYAFGKNYINLVDSTNTGMQSKNTGGMQSNGIGGAQSNATGMCGQPGNKDSSIIHSSINNSSIKDNKERKKNSFDSIIDQYLSPDGMSVRFEDHAERRELLQEWLKVRKAKRAAMTDRAVQMNIDKLDKIAAESNMTVTEYLKEIICRGWAAFYTIRNFAGTGRTEKKPKWMQSTEPRNLDSDEIAAIHRMMNEETEPAMDFEAEAEAFRKRLEEIKEG